MKWNNQICLAFFATAVLAGCGGGGSSASVQPPPVQPPSGLSYAAIPALTINVAAAAQSPTVTGTATSYGVSPALPAGLTLNASSGVISGTPTVLAATANYTVTASNSAGSTTAAVSITVNDLAPAFSYTPGSYTFSQGAPLRDITPASTGGAVVSWSVQPALPAGIVLNPGTGVISGTPTGITARADYTVTALNSGGSAAHVVSIAVESGVLIDLGMASGDSVTDATPTRVLTWGATDWTLWSATGRTVVAHGVGSLPQAPVLAGNTLLVRNQDALESRDATDGSLLATVAYDSTRRWWELSRDGSYFALGGTTGIAIYSRSGARRVARAGDYSTAVAFADNGTLRVAKAPSGANVLEYIDAGNGDLTLSSSFLGTFYSWFGDGQRFFSNTGTTVRVYSLAAVQEDIFSAAFGNSNAMIAGYGNLFMAFSGMGGVDVYTVGNSATPVATYPAPYFTPPVVDGGVIAIPQQNHQWIIVDIQGSAPASALFTTPDDVPSHTPDFAASDGQHWWLTSSYAQVYDGSTGTNTPQYLGFGSIFEIVASPTRIAVATHAHGIQIYDAQTRALERTIALHAGDLSISADGNSLAALPTYGGSALDDYSVRLYSVATGALLNTWPYFYSSGSSIPIGITLSANGAVLGIEMDFDVTNYFSTAGGPSIYSSPALGPLSPDGTYLAETTGSAGPDMNTNLRESGVLRQAVPGQAVTWINDNRLMVSRYAYTSMSIWDYHHTEFYDLAGLLQGSITLGHVPRDVQYIGNDMIYDRDFNDVVSLTTGQRIWASPLTPNVNPVGIGAVAGAHVVFLAGSVVRMELY